MTLSVQCENLCVGWSGKTVVENPLIEKSFDELNCALPLLGRTGRGKSTLLYALAGMSRPLAGRVTWEFPSDKASRSWSGDDVSFKRINDLRRTKFGFLLQDASMIPCFTVAENLRHTLRLRGMTVDIEKRIANAVEDMRIPPEEPGELLGKYPSQLSGGQRQRMALAVAIAHDPAVLFADEPTASLDDASAHEVLRVIRKWLDVGEGRRAFVFATHRTETLYSHVGARWVWELSQLKKGEPAKADWRPLTSEKFVPIE
jgi:ABC-type lipoprotein export system ATPase subunit